MFLKNKIEKSQYCHSFKCKMVNNKAKKVMEKGKIKEKDYKKLAEQFELCQGCFEENAKINLQVRKTRNNLSTVLILTENNTITIK